MAGSTSFGQFSETAADAPRPGVGVFASRKIDQGLFGSFLTISGNPLGCSAVEECADRHYAESLERILLPCTPLDDARRIACSLYAKNADLFASILASRCPEDDETCADRLSRALAIVEDLAHYDPLLPWLYGVAEGSIDRVKSKAVKLLCRAFPSKALVERQLTSRDSRVRANAIEALWFHQTRESKKIFLDGLADPSHRVVVNALIGLCHQNDPIGRQKLIALLEHPSDLFRAAAIWGFAHLYDESAIPALQQMLEKETSESLRAKAVKVLAELLYPREWIAWKSRVTESN